MSSSNGSSSPYSSSQPQPPQQPGLMQRLTGQAEGGLQAFANQPLPTFGQDSSQGIQPLQFPTRTQLQSLYSTLRSGKPGS